MSSILLYKIFVFLVGFLLCLYVLRVGLRHRAAKQRHLEIFHYVLLVIIGSFFLFVLLIPMPDPATITQQQ
ncbi:MAG: hypothetical protein HQK84_00030 [Nitrospinae bacterium]|nr:hypothetical protein [Nitrospinota bacterium]